MVHFLTKNLNFDIFEDLGMVNVGIFGIVYGNLVDFAVI
jgi:hypothetical protein